MPTVHQKYSDGRPMSDTCNVSTLSTSTSGNSVLAQPSSGAKSIRVFYLTYNADGANGADVTASLRFGPSGSLVYTTSLKAGSIFARHIGAGLKFIQGLAGESLYLNLSAAQTVNCTVEWEEVV